MREFGKIERLVVKLGTNILAPEGLPDPDFIGQLAADLATFHRKGLHPILVSSGAIGFGAKTLGLSSRPQEMEMRQACAAIGQPELVDHWRRSLGDHGIIGAQVLLSRESFDDRQSFLNLRNVIEKLLSLGSLPILNENDSVSTLEIGNIFGDNDSLSAHVASKLNANLLIILTDIDALYDRDPRKYDDARPIEKVEQLNEEIRAAAGEAGSMNSTGGMVTKLAAVEVASRAGCHTVLADGRRPGVIAEILEGHEVGTFFPAGSRMGARKRWILGARPKGFIQVDAGALLALEKRKSLLSSGVRGSKGMFNPGDVVNISGQYQAISAMSSEDLRRIMGLRSEEARKLIKPGKRLEVAKADDIVATSLK